MTGTRIARLRAYAVAPATTAPVRYTGHDPLDRMGAEILCLTLADGSEGIASVASGWRGAPVGRLVPDAAAIAE